jgi:hypothetical protein
VTRRLEGDCSIQLSYRGVRGKISAGIEFRCIGESFEGRLRVSQPGQCVDTLAGSP